MFCIALLRVDKLLLNFNFFFFDKYLKSSKSELDLFLEIEVSKWIFDVFFDFSNLVHFLLKTVEWFLADEEEFFKHKSDLNVFFSTLTDFFWIGLIFSYNFKCEK